MPKKPSRKEQSNSHQSARDREAAEILEAVLPMAGSAARATSWYRTQCLPSFGGRTPEDLVREGHAEAIKAYLRRISMGGHA